MPALYPPLEARRTLALAVDGGHVLHVEESGIPDGLPVLFLHGGPGSATKPDHRRYFDPSRYRIVLFDQRGCGRSTPLGSTSANTTWHLVADIERIRDALGVDQWVLFGGSWGSTLALAYAQRHSERVMRMVVRGIFLASASELEWYFVGLRQFIPEAWARLYEAAPGADWRRLVRSYCDLVHHTDPRIAAPAAARWNAYEGAIMSIGETPMMGGSSAADEGAAIARARVQLHYLAHDCFLRDRELLDEIGRIAHIDAEILHGRQDFVCPPVTAYELAQRWPGARLTFVEQAKHASSHPAFESELVRAANDARDARPA